MTGLEQDEILDLLALKRLPDSDDIKIKEKIKQKLLENRKIIYALNNKELLEQDAEPDEYYGINILPFYMIHPTQHNSQNFICFTTGYEEIERFNKSMKLMQITFVVLCEQSNVIDKKTGIARHDLLGALLLDQFNHTNIFGTVITCIEDVESIVDNDYACRTLVFQQTTDNNLVKTRSGATGYARMDVVT